MPHATPSAYAEAREALPAPEKPVNPHATDAAKFFMLGVILIVLIGLLAFILRLRHLSKHPRREVSDLEQLTKE